MVFITLSNIFGVLSPQVIRNAIDLVVRNLEAYNAADSTVPEAEMREAIRKGLVYFCSYFSGIGSTEGLVHVSHAANHHHHEPACGVRPEE